MSSRKRKSIPSAHSRGLWKRSRNNNGAAVERKGDEANAAAAPDLDALGLPTQLRELSVDGKDAKVGEEFRVINDNLKALHTGQLALARLILSTTKRLSTVDARALWVKHKERILEAARTAMGAKFESAIEDLYKLDASWKETTVTEFCNADSKISADLRRCADPSDFLLLAAKRASAVLNTQKSSLRALAADIVLSLNDLRKLVKAGFVGPNGEEVPEDEAEPVRDLVVIADRIAASIKARLKEETQALHFTDQQLDKLTAHVSELHRLFESGKAPTWLSGKAAGLNKDQAAGAAEAVDGDD